MSFNVCLRNKVFKCGNGSDWHFVCVKYFATITSNIFKWNIFYFIWSHGTWDKIFPLKSFRKPSWVDDFKFRWLEFLQMPVLTTPQCSKLFINNYHKTMDYSNFVLSRAWSDTYNNKNVHYIHVQFSLTCWTHPSHQNVSVYCVIAYMCD